MSQGTKCVWQTQTSQKRTDKQFRDWEFCNPGRVKAYRIKAVKVH